MSNRIFSPRSKPARELYPNPQSSGGSYHLKSAEDLIAYHRKLKNRTLTDWPGRIHRMLTVGVAASYLSSTACILACLRSEGGGDSKLAQNCFTAAIWASGVMTVLILAKCYMNSNHPRK